MSRAGGPRLQAGLAVRLGHQAMPLLLGLSMALVGQRATGRPLSPAGLAMLLAGIAAAYAFDRLTDPADPPRPGLVRGYLLVSCLLATLVGIALLPSLPWSGRSQVLLFGALALGYRAWKPVPLAKTLGIPVVWTWAGLALPTPEGSWFGWRALLGPVTVPLFLLLTAGCLLCDLKDLARDRANGIGTLPVRLGIGRTRLLAGALAAAAVLWALHGRRIGLAAAGSGLLLLDGLPAVVRADDLGPLLVDLALSLPGLLIATRLV